MNQEANHDMEDLEGMDGWKHREPELSDDVTEDAEIWSRINDPAKEVIIDRSNPDEPRDWTVILPDGRKLYSNDLGVVEAIAELYMRTGSV